ncbi:MAG TPA: zinc ribbon domain-containing protein, partial [Candidatus Aminicenantes bacterium]|nr:zinc ribbon domain-containing protein [Candidatus Aminicenantes bacterium]
MPIYEYKCLHCGYCFELFQKINDSGPEACPRCGGPVQKIVSAPAIHFKGSGWYVTDYARPNPSNSAHKEKAAEKKSEEKKTGEPTTSSPEKKSDSK